MSKVIAIASQKGGVGKTTTAVNLAAFLTHAGHRVLLMDVDPQGNATSGVGVERSEQGTLQDLLSGKKSWRDVLVASPTEGLYVLPATEKPAANETLTFTRPQVQRLRAALHDDLDLEWIIVDCPPSFGPLPRLALELADSVLIPVQSEYYAMEGLSQILPVIEDVNKHRPEDPLEIEGLLITMFAPELDLSHEVLNEIREYFPDRTLETVVPRDVALAEASSHGIPVCDYDLRSRGAWAYMNLAKEILEHDTEKAG